MSKGSTPRPFAVAQEEYASNWDRIFKAKPIGSLNKLENDNDGAGQPDKEGSGPAEGLG